MTRRAVAGLGLALAVLAIPAGVAAYLKIGVQVGTKVVALQWKTLPVQYYITSRDATGVTAAQLQTAVDQSFGAWTSVPTATLSTHFVGFTAVDASVDSGLTVIGFESHPELDRVLGSTSWELDAVSGEPRAAHIFLNTAFNWSIAATGEAAKFDVRSVATHEIGHLFGLSHSALGETTLNTSTGGRSILGKAAVMFPIAYPPSTTLDRNLTPDDIAGISDIYATTAFRQQFGQVSGRVTLAGAGVFGAHVFAFNQRTGAIVGGFTLDNSGSFVISGLTPGLYLVRAEPIDDADLDSFFDATTVVNINFKATYYNKLVAVPPGGASGTIEIKVTAK